MQYLNDQESATLWYHDHALGITRLNVYAGLAGFYLLQDEVRLGLTAAACSPSGAYDIGMAIQDRSFTADGQLYLPAFETIRSRYRRDGRRHGPPGVLRYVRCRRASILPEFFGDVILVNGMAWPDLDVAAGDYNFRILNGSDSRFYVLSVSDPDVAIHLVGVDGGLLTEAITISDGDGIQEDRRVCRNRSRRPGGTRVRL